MKRTNEEFLELVYGLVGDEYSVLSEYKNARTKVIMRHNTCGYEYPQIPDHFLNQGSRCPKCASENRSLKQRRTVEEFKAKVYEAVGDEYTVLGEYVNSQTKILMRHNTCGEEFEIRPNSFLRGVRHSKCAQALKSEKRRKSQAQFVDDVYNLVGDEYAVLGKYAGAKRDILIKHNQCGTEFTTLPSNFLNGKRCPECKGLRISFAKRWKPEVFYKKVNELVGDEYTVLGEYTNSATPIRFRHNICGTEYSATPNSFLQGHRCDVCMNKIRSNKLKMSNDTFVARVSELIGNEYTFLEEYNKANIPILVRHNICGNEYKVSPNAFLGGKRCKKCVQKRLAEAQTKTQEEFKKEVYDLVGDEFTVLGEYVNTRTKVLMRHNTCGREFLKSPGDFLYNKSFCAVCARKESGGVRKINDVLRKKNITFSYEKTYDDLVGIRRLKYDFCLKDSDSHMLIEFDGFQHFRPTIWEKITDILLQRQEALERLLLQHEYDIKKNRFAEENNIPLLRIRYNQVDKIEELIDDLLDRPEWYINNHNKFLSEKEYYAPFYENIEKYRDKERSNKMQVAMA